MARPKIENKANKLLQLRVTQQEKDEFEKKLSECGMTVSSFFRMHMKNFLT